MDNKEQELKQRSAIGKISKIKQKLIFLLALVKSWGEGDLDIIQGQVRTN